MTRTWVPVDLTGFPVHVKIASYNGSCLNENDCDESLQLQPFVFILRCFCISIILFFFVWSRQEPLFHPICLLFCIMYYSIGFCICVPISLLFLLSFWRDLARRSHISVVFICICDSFVFLFLLSFWRDLARRSPASSYGRSSCLTGFSHGLKIIDGDLCQDGNDDDDDQDHENHDQDYDDDDDDDDHNYQHYDDNYNQAYLKWESVNSRSETAR